MMSRHDEGNSENGDGDAKGLQNDLLEDWDTIEEITDLPKLKYHKDMEGVFLPWFTLRSGLWTKIVFFSSFVSLVGPGDELNRYATLIQRCQAVNSVVRAQSNEVNWSPDK